MCVQFCTRFEDSEKLKGLIANSIFDRVELHFMPNSEKKQC